MNFTKEEIDYIESSVWPDKEEKQHIEGKEQNTGKER